MMQSNNSSSSLDYKTSMMQGGLLNQEKPFLLPPDFQPSKWDITIPCGWVKSKEHSGNARFLDMCQQQLENYEKCTSKVERSIVIHRIVLSVMAGSPTQTGFVNRDKTTGRWHFIGMTRARERVGYVLRRAIADKKAKAEKIKRGEPIDEPKKKTRKSKKASAAKKQEQTGIAWRVAPSKLGATTTESSSETDAAGVASKSLATRRRKLPIGLTNKIASTVLGDNSEEQIASPEQASKRQRTVPSISLTKSTPEKNGKNSPPPSAVISQALHIAKPTTTESSHPLLAAARANSLLATSGAGGLSSSLYNSLAAGPKDIYLEAAIREHAAMRERSAMRESAALRELAYREHAADAVLRERLALRDAMQERLAIQEESILRERIKMHEEAAHRERLALRERLSKRGAEAQQDMPVAEALAAAKAKKAGENAGASRSLLTPAQRAAALQARSLYSAALLGSSSSSDPLAAKYSALYSSLSGYPPMV